MPLKPKKIPMRMCVGCREMRPKAELLRVVKPARRSGATMGSHRQGPGTGRICVSQRGVPENAPAKIPRPGTGAGMPRFPRRCFDGLGGVRLSGQWTGRWVMLGLCARAGQAGLRQQADAVQLIRSGKGRAWRCLDAGRGAATRARSVRDACHSHGGRAHFCARQGRLGARHRQIRRKAVAVLDAPHGRGALQSRLTMKAVRGPRHLHIGRCMKPNGESQGAGRDQRTERECRQGAGERLAPAQAVAGGAGFSAQNFRRALSARSANGRSARPRKNCKQQYAEPRRSS